MPLAQLPINKDFPRPWACLKASISGLVHRRAQLLLVAAVVVVLLLVLLLLLEVSPPVVALVDQKSNEDHPLAILGHRPHGHSYET